MEMTIAPLLWIVVATRHTHKHKHYVTVVAAAAGRGVFFSDTPCRLSEIVGFGDTTAYRCHGPIQQRGSALS